jgi:excisionase family DNA binding protein
MKAISEAQRARDAAAARKAKRKASWQKRIATEPFLREHVRLSQRISQAIVYRRDYQLEIRQVLGCRVDTARAHLERQFKPGMTWANHGRRWHIDHKRQKNEFLYKVTVGAISLDAYRRRVHHYTNLRPMWIRDHRRRPWKVYRTHRVVLLTTADCAARLGISRDRVRALIRSGRLRARKRWRQWLIDARALKTIRGWTKSAPPKPSAPHPQPILIPQPAPIVTPAPPPVPDDDPFDSATAVVPASAEDRR